MATEQPRVGILAIQGDVEAHARSLERLGALVTRVLRDKDLAQRLLENGQVALTYRSSEGEGDSEPKAAGGAYPDNPNGSIMDIAGICNEKGNVLGLMPHPERFVHRLQAPSWTRNPPGAGESSLGALSSAGDGFSIFSRAVSFVNDRADKIS